MNIFSRAYYKDLEHFFRELIPDNSKTINANNQGLKGKFDYIILPNTLAEVDDVQNYIGKLRLYCTPSTKIVVVYFNFLWKPVLDLASAVGLRTPSAKEPNWLSGDDIQNLFELEGFDEVKRGSRLILPLDNKLAKLINRYLAQLPLINNLCLTTYQIFRIKPPARKYSVSIIIPARNEAGNMKGVLSKIPQIGERTEAIFVEGNSTDNTYRVIKNEISSNKTNIKAFLYKQKGKGKGDAVRLGFKKAKNDILMILDADLTVSPNDLIKFYMCLAEGYAEFVNGSRLVYPMEKQAMRTLNYFGNKLFSITFTYLLGQRIKDTLCGTKVLFRRDYLKIERNRKYFGDFDPFGDFDLLFGASKLNLKIVEIPVRYRERIYGTTNISRFTHGLLLLRMVMFAARKIKFT